MTQGFALIIDDNMDNVEMCTILMHIEKYTTMGVYDGSEAIQWLIVNDAPDVILLDVNMPHIDGRQVYEYIRSESKYAGTKIVVVTANSYMANLMQSILCSGDYILQKPFSMLDLQQIIREIHTPA